MERLHSHAMNRRTFLKVAGAFASIEVGGPDDGGFGDGTVPPAVEEDLASIARSLPAAGALAADDGIEYSVTRLDGEGTTATEKVVTDATAYGTVFAGPTAVDVAVGLPDGRAFLESLRSDGYDVLGTHRGWTILERGARTRHRTAAVADSTAIVGVSPVAAAVRNDVRETMTAVTRAPENRIPGTEVREHLIDHLDAGTHLSVDATPDPRRTAESVVATGERYVFETEHTRLRSATLFDSVGAARAAGLDDTRRVPLPAETSGSIDRHGRAVVRDATVPTEQFLSGP